MFGFTIGFICGVTVTVILLTLYFTKVIDDMFKEHSVQIIKLLESLDYYDRQDKADDNGLS